MGFDISEDEFTLAITGPVLGFVEANCLERQGNKRVVGIYGIRTLNN
jgi:hypothetical protein